MKKYFFCCLAVIALLLPNTGKSQDSSTIQGLLQYIMQPLDKNQIGNGYLEEYGLPAISMATYNGVLSANNRFELNSWRLMYFQLFTSWCRATANPMATITTVNNTRKIYSHSDYIGVEAFNFTIQNTWLRNEVHHRYMFNFYSLCMW